MNNVKDIPATRLQPSSMEVMSLYGQKGHLDIPNTRYESALTDIPSMRPPFESLYDAVDRIQAHDLEQEKVRNSALFPLAIHRGQTVPPSEGLGRRHPFADKLLPESLKGAIYTTSI